MTANTTLTRKIVLAFGAALISTATIAGASQAQAGVKIYLGSGWGNGHHTGGHFCDYYWYKYKKTGKFYFKKKYLKCIGYW